MKLGIFSVLTIVFVIAKLGGYIAWSWWLVFSPLLVSGGFTILILVIMAIAAVLPGPSLTRRRLLA